MINNSFMQYKVPTRLDMGKLRVEFRSSYEPTGPFGAKSIGEIVINTPLRRWHMQSKCDGSVVPRTADHERADCNGNCGKRMRVTILYLAAGNSRRFRGK